MMSKSKTAMPPEQAPHSNRNEMHTAWITGMVAALSVILLAFLFQQLDAISSGLTVFGWKLSDNKNHTALIALLAVATTVFVCDSLRVFVFEKSKSIQLHPDLQNKNAFGFAYHCILRYIEAVITLWLILFFYKTAGEYGYERQAEFYLVWFRLLEWAWCLVLLGGLPYIVVSAALTDSKNTTHFGLFNLIALLAKIITHTQTEADKANHSLALAQLRSLVLRMVFLPLMTVLFTQHFAALVQSLDHIGNRLNGSLAHINYTHQDFNRDLVKTSMAMILGIAAAIGWCGYALTSRWLDNHFRSTDASLLGWTVCLLSFPPFTLAVTWFFKGPMEHGFLSIDNQIVVSVLGCLFIGLFTISLSATLCFGARYSNLSNRGIIRIGPYALVRHPDYAAINLAWWLTGVPFILLVMNRNGFAAGATLMIGLCINTIIFYWRAITEEKHLLNDPEYVDYCKQVKWRFIPGVI